MFSGEIQARTPRGVIDPRGHGRVLAKAWMKQGRGMNLGKLTALPGFENLPRCWVVDHAFAWTSYDRHISNEQECLRATGENFL